MGGHSLMGLQLADVRAGECGHTSPTFHMNRGNSFVQGSKAMVDVKNDVT